MIWKNRDWETKEAVRIVRCENPGPFYTTGKPWVGLFHAEFDWVEIKRTDGSSRIVCSIRRRLPRNNAMDSLLICSCCYRPKRFLYAWEAAGRFTSSAESAPWPCRTYVWLRYASEAGALVFRSRSRLSRMIEAICDARAERPQRWYPYVFSSPNDAKAAGLV